MAAGPPRVVAHPPLPAWSVGVSFGGLAASLGPVAVGGMGGTAELALGHERWQLFGEATVMRVTAGDHDAPVVGMRQRAGLGARYLARSFHLDRSGGVELMLEAGLGAEAYRWSGGGHLARPDLGFGWSVKVRMFHLPLSVGLGIRLAVSPSFGDTGTAARVVCRGVCPPTAARPLDFSFSPTLGISW
ncbi:MAG: hypothetical protein M3619_26195 [Myxococcota bacterium]|nr:hypothetical protein [Myxococcota bacterium]